MEGAQYHQEIPDRQRTAVATRSATLSCQASLLLVDALVDGTAGRYAKRLQPQERRGA